MKLPTGKGRSHLNFVLMAGALLCFILIAAGTAPAATFKSVNGEVVIEAETYTRLGGTIGGKWFIDKKISGYSGTGYIESTTNDEGQTRRFDKNIIRAEYDIDFQETGKYYLHLRTYSVDHTTNGFFAAIDGRPFDYGHKDGDYVHVGKRSKWFWYTKGSGPEKLVPRGPEYKVSIDITKKGVQTLGIYRRDDDGSRVDKIWLTKHQSVPQKTETLDLTSPAVFIVGGGSPSPQPSPSPDGETPILLEAEDFNAKIQQGDHEWLKLEHKGAWAMEAVPDEGTKIIDNYVNDSPYLSFDVNFAKTGTYYIWLRGFCTGRDNSAHVGLNGQAVRAAKNIKLPRESAWVWSGTRANGNRATVRVNKTGPQTIEVYMREDGLILDAIKLTTSAGYTPSD